MRTHLLQLLTGTLISLSLLAPGTGQAQIFDDPENLQVLPEDISPAQLRATMRSFAMGTGMRCSSCHLGEEGQPLETYDFASDEEERKLIARDMLRMVQRINDEHLAGMDEVGDDRLRVTCSTCHRGQPKPWMLADRLDASFEDGGTGALLGTYEELRGRYYGGYQYDFSEWSLLNYADTLAQRGEMAAAQAVVETNLEHHPDSEWTLMSLAQLAAAGGEVQRAVELLDQVLAINPDNRQAAGMRAQLASPDG